VPASSGRDLPVSGSGGTVTNAERVVQGWRVRWSEAD
jgi:hypothetical protein